MSDLREKIVIVEQARELLEAARSVEVAVTDAIYRDAPFEGVQLSWRELEDLCSEFRERLVEKGLIAQEPAPLSIGIEAMTDDDTVPEMSDG